MFLGKKEFKALQSDVGSLSGKFMDLESLLHRAVDDRHQSTMVTHHRDPADFAAQADILSLMKLLRPKRAKHFEKIRVGSPNDGGYIMLDDFKSLTTAFSFGVEQNAEWDMQMADRGITIHQFDGTIDLPPGLHERIFFHKKMIMPVSSETTESVEALVAAHDAGGDTPNLLLKIDIEHGEWPVFEATSAKTLSRFSQITGEFHGFDFAGDPRWRQAARRVFEKIAENFDVVHVHANNYCQFSCISNVMVPAVMEITFANRNVYELVETDETFPTPLDRPCDPSRPDLCLGSFKFE